MPVSESKPKSPRRRASSSQPSEPARYICVHGHFYQPPRENPWLETVEVQDSAAPYHDWNDRITAECYAPNGASRITNPQSQIIRIVNNYSRMSFNFGPTLLSWLADNAPRTYRMILDADKASMRRYGGHGSAMAQVYNHVILPLASERDALTQIRWGIADFEFRFGRRPEGMWLAETAVNRNVLDLMAREGIQFTVLAPGQCARVRRIPTAEPAAAPRVPTGDPAAEQPASEPSWLPTPDASVDTTHPYRIPLNEGRSIVVFFYDGPASRAIAFEGLLNSGEVFAQRLMRAFHPPAADEPDTAQLSHVATDGESYGHHHRHGEMALSYAMHWIEEQKLARLTNYGEFLEKFPPRWEAEVVDNTSWSCFHGIERWRSNCGCNGGRQGWNQKWRKPLRDALDLLRDRTAPLAEMLSRGLLKDLWAARDAYIHVVLNRTPEVLDRFFAEHQARELSPRERITVLELLELERHTQLMYTSCGWFFDEISGIETVQIIAYAGRVLQLAAHLFGRPGAALESEFLRILATAKSNLPEIGDGAEVYRRYVTGMKIGLEQVGAHYAISSIFRPYPQDGGLFCYDLRRDSYEVFASGRGRVSIGKALVRSRVTEESEEICFAVLHLGDQNLSAAVRRYDAASDDPERFAALTTEVRAAVLHANLPEVIHSIDRFFGQMDYSLVSLFADEEHRILRTILDRTLAETEQSLQKIYDDHSSLLQYLHESGMAPPPALALAASYTLNARLRNALDDENFDPALIQSLFDRAATEQVSLDKQLLSFTAGMRMKRAMVALEDAAEGEISAMAGLASALTIALALRTMPLEVNLWQSQNIWNDLLRRGDRHHWLPEWTEGFKQLGEAMNICVDQLVVEEGVTAF